MYIREFFNNLHEIQKEKRAHVKQITDNFEIFDQKLNHKIDEVTDLYFGFKKELSICDDEW